MSELRLWTPHHDQWIPHRDPAKTVRTPEQYMGIALTPYIFYHISQFKLRGWSKRKIVKIKTTQNELLMQSPVSPN